MKNLRRTRKLSLVIALGVIVLTAPARARPGEADASKVVIRGSELASLLRDVSVERILPPGLIVTPNGPQIYGADGSYSQVAEGGKISGSFKISGDAACASNSKGLRVCRYFFRDGKGSIWFGNDPDPKSAVAQVKIAPIDEGHD